MLLGDAMHHATTQQNLAPVLYTDHFALWHDPLQGANRDGVRRIIKERNNTTAIRQVKVDIRTAEDLSRYFRNDVLESAEVQYVEG